jgi:hypothetical protein
MGNQVTQMDNNDLLEQHTSTSSKAFPKTTIISISTHGEIRLNKEITNVSDIKYDTDGLASSVLPVFQINPNIKEFYKYNAVVPGVFSYAAGNSDFGDGMDAEKSSRSKNGIETGDLIVGEEVSAVNRSVRDIILKTPGFDRVSMSTLSQEIANEVKHQTQGIKTKVEGYKKDLERKRKEQGGELDEEDEYSLRFFTDYLNTYPQANKIVNCLEGGNRKMVNKTFLLNSNDLSPAEDWSITCLNNPFIQRNKIFDEVYNSIRGSSRLTGRNRRRTITLQDIVDYIGNNGAERLIIIDLTCCPVFGPYIDDPNVADTEYKGATIRMIRRNIFNDGRGKYGGGKKRHSRKRKYKNQSLKRKNKKN